jgi:hypothetical protein
MAYKGFFNPKNPQKYRGNPSNIIYRSSWELKLMIHLDSHPDVLQWSSEEFFIPYRSPIDGRIHRYFPDFYVKKKNKEGKVEVSIIEIKPFAQTQEPKRQSNITRRYITEVKTYGINSSKWKAAEEYCKDRGWSFEIFTEKELKIDF